MRQEKGHIPYPNAAPSEELYRFGADGNLRLYSYDRLFFALYGYDGGTTRTYKYSFDLNPNWVNGRLEAVNFNLHNAMFYPNSYLNFNTDGYYTKHYYNGMERIASRLGDNNLLLATHDPELQDRKWQLDSNIRRNIVDITGYEFLPVGEEQNPEDPKPIYDLPVIGISNLQPSADGIFYYHPNHLGSTCYVTDENASVVQGFLYAPFGEITNEYNSSFGSSVLPKYSFNAKELDEETGMYYYEARYMAPPVFISRDVLFEEKPWLTPYHYCSNNPVNSIDPDGKDDIHINKDGRIVKYVKNKSSNITIINPDGTRRSYSDYKIKSYLFGMGNIGNRKIIANVTGFYARKIGIKGTVGATGTTMDNNVTAFYNHNNKGIWIPAGKNGKPHALLNNKYNLMNVLLHEYHHKLDDGEGKNSNHYLHASVVERASSHWTFQNASSDYQLGQVGYFAQLAMNAYYQPNKNTKDDVLNLIDVFNNTNKGNYCLVFDPRNKYMIIYGDKEYKIRYKASKDNVNLKY